MATASSDEKPLLLNASGDFSHLKTVSYKGRFLYSKYNPLRTVVSVIERTTLLPGSLLIICSPCLWYGFSELLSALPEDCTLIALEAERELFALARQQQPSEAQEVRLFHTDDSAGIDRFLREAAEHGSIKRAVQLDFSAGAQLQQDSYRRITAAAQEIIATFWTNRITLVRMGRLFAKNIFQNADRLGSDAQLADIAHCVGRPIIVCGAGESLDSTPLPSDGSAYIIAVDVALAQLLARNVPVNAAVSLEGQSVIEKAYIGAKSLLDSRNDFTFFADISSRPSVAGKLPGNTVWFASAYTQAGWLNGLRESGLVKEYCEPLGSVGLAATYIALELRRDSSVPVYVTGLDFCYSAGLTHAKETPAHKARLGTSGRLQPAENFAAAFAPGTMPCTDKRNKTMVTSRILMSYARHFAQRFSGTAGLYDAGFCGIPLGLPQKPLPHGMPGRDRLQHRDDVTQALAELAGRVLSDRKERCAAFYAEEKRVLLCIQSLLSEGDKSPQRDAGLTLSEQLRGLLAPREYLYLHFPDGYRLSLEAAFLKRVRAETDFFLKQIAIGTSGRT